jgi:hypothetical protein
MNMKRPIALISILVLAASLFSACAQSKPFKYHSGNEIPEGPGLLSKEKGEFTLYDSNKQAAAPQPQATGATVAPAGAAAASAPAMTAPPADSAEFQQFQEWKKEQQEFEAFQEWKKSEKGSREYEEFQEWKRWKAYSEWMESQKKPPVKP